jgi:ATP-dependent 26S proteasome regulatory subunit
MLLYGPPGTGKSTFVYRLAMSTNRHIISIDLNNVTHKRNAYQIIQNPYSEDMKPSEYIILLEEFDNVVLNLKAKETIKHKTNINSKKDNDKNDDKQVIEVCTDDFELNDLLEIFQGPVPREGQIIIATTNKYDEIKEVCPALFRPGRLTPVEFGYMTSKEVNELANVYFGHEVDIKFNPQIPTSKIIEIALYAKLNNDPDYFVREMNKNK